MFVVTRLCECIGASESYTCIRDNFDIARCASSAYAIKKLLPERSDLNVYHGEAIIHRHIENMYHDFSIVIKLMQPVP